MGPLFAARCIMLVVTSFTLAHGKTIDVNNSTYLRNLLCEEGQSSLEANTTLLLTEPHYTISSGNSCLIENINDLTILGSSDKFSTVTIQCLLNEGENTSRGFVFIGTNRLTLANIVFENCGAVVPERVLELGKSSLIHFGHEETAVLVCRSFYNLTLSNVQVTDYNGRAFVGIDIIDHSVLDAVVVSRNMANSRVCYEHYGDARCMGSGVVWTYANDTNASKSATVDIIDSEFMNNTGYRASSDNKPFICGDLIASLLYSTDTTRVPLKAVSIPSAGALSFMLQQHFPVRVRIRNTKFIRNSGLCYGAVLAIYFTESDYNSLSFSECEFSRNTQIVTNITYLSAGYFGATITLLMKFTGGSVDEADCFSMTDSHFDSLVQLDKNVEIVLAQFPAGFGSCTATLHNITGGNTKLLYAVSLNTGGSTFYINLSDIRLIGDNSNHDPKLDIGEGLITFSYITEVNIYGSLEVGSVFSKVYGPIIAAEVTNVVLTGQLEFSNAIVSTWTKGAAIYLRGESKLWLKEPLNVTFCNNSALQGGAIYSVSTFAEYCAFQFITRPGKVYNDRNIGDIDIHVSFISNSAHLAGNAIYAFPLDKCSIRLSPTIDVTKPNVIYKQIFKFIPPSDPENNELFDMSSRPLRVCLCGNDPRNTSAAALTCQNPDVIYTYPGRTFNLSIVALDELSHKVYSIIYNDIDSHVNSDETDWRLGYGENIVKAGGHNCTTMKVTTLSQKVPRNGLLTSYADESIIPFSIPISLNDCPPGFSLDDRDYCDCMSLLAKNNIVCDISNSMVTRPGSTWIGIVREEYTVEHGNYSDPVNVTIGYSSHCPTRYCNETLTQVDVSNNASICLFNRTGILCGQCQTGLSVTVGSPVCRKCPNLWLLTIPLYAIIGIVVVALMLLVQLTVVQGTINGLIFYANLLNINTYTVIAGYRGSEWAIIMVSFLNLELGFPVCLYDGMDELDKALLSIVFPAYIWLLAILFIFASRYSQRFSQLTSQSAIPVLATLLYISYFKLLRFSVNGLAFGTVYMQGPSRQISQENVWYYDGNVRYLHDSRHILLFIMVLVVLCTFVIPYGVVLTGIRFFGRFRIVNQFKPLIDAYFAPYKDRYRFWFGARLWVLLIVYILFAILRYNPLAHILSQGVILTVFTLAQVALMPFKNNIINWLDLSFMVNALLLTMVILYTYSSSAADNYAPSVSIAITLVMFCVIIGYHAWKPLKLLLKHCRVKGKYVALNEAEENVVTRSSLVIASSSEVAIESPGPPVVNPSKYRDSILEDTIADTDSKFNDSIQYN